MQSLHYKLKIIYFLKSFNFDWFSMVVSYCAMIVASSIRRFVRPGAYTTHRSCSFASYCMTTNDSDVDKEKKKCISYHQHLFILHCYLCSPHNPSKPLDFDQNLCYISINVLAILIQNHCNSIKFCSLVVLEFL